MGSKNGSCPPPTLLTKDTFGPEAPGGWKADKDENSPGLHRGCWSSELVTTAEGPLHLTFNHSRAPMEL